MFQEQNRNILLPWCVALDTNPWQRLANRVNRSITPAPFFFEVLEEGSSNHSNMSRRPILKGSIEVRNAVNKGLLPVTTAFATRDESMIQRL